jgi:hypothetical protein
MSAESAQSKKQKEVVRPLTVSIYTDILEHEKLFTSTTLFLEVETTD